MKITRCFTSEDESQIPGQFSIDWPRQEVDSFGQAAFFQTMPDKVKPVEENTMPSWLWRHTSNSVISLSEKKPQDVFRRLAGAATYAGWKKDLFTKEDEARSFYDEVLWAFGHKLIIAEPSTLAFVGTEWAYGIKTPTRTTKTSKQQQLALTNREIDSLLAESNPVAHDRWNRLIKNIEPEHPLSVLFSDTAEEWGYNETSTLLPITINLPLLSRESDGAMDGQALQQVTRLTVILLDLLMETTQQKIDDNRAMEIGFCGLAEFLLSQGLTYDSPAARATASAISSIITATAVETSAQLAQFLGVCSGFNAQRAHHLRIIANRRRAAYGDTNDYEHVSVLPLPLTLGDCPDLSLIALTRHAWDQAIIASQRYGLRHTQLTSLRHFPTVPFLTNGATTGLAPIQSLVRERQIADEEFRREIHPLVPKVLAHLGYDPADIKAMVDHVVGYNTLVAAPGLSHAHLKAKGFTDEILERLENYLPRVRHISHAFTPWVLGFSFCKDTLKISDKKLNDYAFDLLKHLGFSSESVAIANAFCCGHKTLSDAAELAFEHRPIFSSGNEVSSHAFLTMAAAMQCFITGEIDLALTLPAETKTTERSDLILNAWRKGLKNVRLSINYALEKKSHKNEAKAKHSLHLRHRASTGRPAPQSAHALTEAITAPTHGARTKAPTKVVGLTRRTTSRLHKTGR